jgi:23S rRNA pseudouridine1911/1915/1917 synthase
MFDGCGCLLAFACGARLGTAGLIWDGCVTEGQLFDDQPWGAGMSDSGQLIPLLALEELRTDDLLCCRGNWLAINKPGGVLTQAPPGIDSIELRAYRWREKQVRRAELGVQDAAMPYIRRAEPELQDAVVPYIGVPHRLDRPVSGVMLLGLSRNLTRKLSELFQRREVSKHYWAVVEGAVDSEAGTWSDFMRKIPDQARSEIVSAEHPEAQLAVLNYRVLGRAAGLTWLRVELETGRTHQIRLQCSARGHPVIGDELYGSQSAFGPSTTDLRERWIGLHARRLSFRDPGGSGNERLDLVAPLYTPWAAIVVHFPQMLELNHC